MDHTDQIIAESVDCLVAHYNEPPERDFPGVNAAHLLQYMNMNHVREFFPEGESSQGASHDLFVSCKPRHKGEELQVTYGFHSTKLGEIMVGQTSHGVCYLGFLVDQDRNVPFHKMEKHLSHADFVENAGKTRAAVDEVMRIWRGQGDPANRLKLDLHGTNMQIQVWQALLKIPTGQTTSYMNIAKQIGRPKAARAVGSAVGANPVSLLIPCHRVIQASGIVNNYGWGDARKKLLLGLESVLLT